MCGGRKQCPKLIQNVPRLKWIRKIHYLYYIRPVLRGNPRVCFIPLGGIWFMPIIHLNKYLTIKKTIFIGVQLILAGLQAIRTSSMVPCLVVPPPSCLRGCQISPISADSGKWLTNIRSRFFIRPQPPFGP